VLILKVVAGGAPICALRYGLTCKKEKAAGGLPHSKRLFSVFKMILHVWQKVNKTVRYNCKSLKRIEILGNWVGLKEQG
jgi:hypothetical protein